MTNTMESSEDLTVSVNFYSDWTALLREGLENAGYSIGPTEDDAKVGCLYFNATKRKIDPRPRRILISREFSCPTEFLQGLHLLEDRIRNGHDLTPHLSRKILSADYDDPILNDWGVHHFHLGLTNRRL